MFTSNVKSYFVWPLAFIVGLLFVARESQNSDTVLDTISQKRVTNTMNIVTSKKGDTMCPVSTKTRRYSQGNEDKGLFERMWSDPNKCHGTFVELGALNGVRYSNTKYFEDYLGWNGVLIEALPNNYKNLKANRKKTINYHTAICKEGVNFVEFAGNSAIGGVISELPASHINYFKIDTNNSIKVPCEPIGPLLRKSNITKIDLFSLDVEGSELMVLETMDWTIPVHVFVVEKSNKDKWEAVDKLLTDNGFQQAEWDIQDYCTRNCPDNVVYVNPNYV